jgi:glutamate dehydrogenase
LDRGDEKIARVTSGSGLGALRDPAVLLWDDLRDGASIPPAVAAFLARDDLIAVSKSQRRSTVHRSVLMDSIVVKRFDEARRPNGEYIFAGLFSAKVYNRSAHSIPLLRRKLARVLERSGFEPRSHDARVLANIVETFPRDELFQVSDDQLHEVSLGILQLEQRQRVALFLRRDDFDRFISCLVFVPRDRFTTQLRLAIQAILERAFAGKVAAQYTQLGDAPLARLHILVQTVPDQIPPFDRKDLEAEIVAAARSWSDHLLAALEAAHGEEEGCRLHLRYRDAFPLGYRERFNAEQAIADIQAIELALAGGQLGMALYRPFAAADMQFRLKVYQRDQPIVLSHALPILEHLGLRVVDEVPHAVRVRGERQRTVMIHDFGLETQSGAAIELSEVADRFRQAFLAVWEGRVESDRLNALVTSAGLTVNQAGILRAYSKYLRQAGIPFTQAYLERVLNAHPAIAGTIVRLFLALFDPDAEGDPESRAAPMRAGIAAALDEVASAEDDRILRRFLNLVEATLRTNYFQTDSDGQPKPYLSIKLDSRKVDDLPLPRPMVEVFVYSPRVEGIHLRGGKVARGGIRWSDRREDFRTEVLGLMKAQMVKNAVIVPVGAKGGFVVKRPPDPSDREAWQAEGIACYSTLITGLLDLTDNLTGAGVVPPPCIVRRDGDDPYLVVAADKGTATFSDIANGIAAEYDFWLGDAFASGGSRGYDHKAMGITARGAWEGVKRHFREMGRDIQQEEFTVVGVGDMSGDVFGNGMLLSPHIKLLAAFDHRHIFVDPDPDQAVALAERQRLFNLPRSTWESYDRTKMSVGGEVFDRRAKMLMLTPQIRARFGIDAERLTPNQLIRELLRAEVDLLWFGGIGTFVKCADESHAEAGDRANDSVRVDARELRCKVIGEGANLGITQLGRIEFARAGGRINTDFIDNSAGVDCSDHEVNIKILLDAVVAEGDLTTKQRNQLLVAMTDEVAALVLRDNYLQTQAISLTQAEGFGGLDAHARLTRLLERQGRLNRAVEFLPDEEALTERAALRQGLTRPELAVLFSYCKVWLNDEILASDLPDDQHLAVDVVHYFPSALRDRFRAPIARHRLKRELIASSITNSLINRMGGTFVVDISEKTGMPPVDIARAYIIARDVFAVRDLWRDIEAQDGVVPAATQGSLHREVQRLLEHGTLWFLRNRKTPFDISANIAAFEQPLARLSARLADVLPEKIKQRIADRSGYWQAQGVPTALAERIANLTVLPSACDIIRIASARGIEAEGVARLYFSIGQQLGFGWLRDSAQNLSATGYWQRLAASAMIEELYAHQRDVTLKVLASAGEPGDGTFEAWSHPRQSALDRSRALLTELEAAKDVDLSMLAVASRQLRALTES